MDKYVRKLFYEMYPDSDPKYWPYFKFVEHTKGGKLVSIDVYFRDPQRPSTIRIIKGKNDKDVRWSRFLHSYRRREITLGGAPFEEERHRVDVEHRGTPSTVARVLSDTYFPQDDIYARVIAIAIMTLSAYMLWPLYYKRSRHGRKS